MSTIIPLDEVSDVPTKDVPKWNTDAQSSTVIPLDEVSDVNPVMQGLAQAKDWLKGAVLKDQKTKAAVGENLILGGMDVLAQGVSGIMSGSKLVGDRLKAAVIGKPETRSAADAYTEEFQRSYNYLRSKYVYEPKTVEGQKLEEAIGKLFGKAMDYTAEMGYHLPYGVLSLAEGAVTGKTTKSPVGGAVGKALIPALMFAAPYVKAGKDIPLNNQVKGLSKQDYEFYKDPNWIERYASTVYPETLKALQASSVGKGIKQAAAGKRDVYTAVHKVLNDEIGEGASRMPLTQKLDTYFNKLDPEKKVLPTHRNAIITGLEAQLDELNKIANRGKTVEQLVEERTFRPVIMDVQKTIEAQTGVRQPLGPKNVKTRAADFKAALNENIGKVVDPETQVIRDATAAEMLDYKLKNLPQERVRQQTVVTDKTIQQIIDETTGVAGTRGSKDMKKARDTPSGVWTAGAEGQLERQLTLGEYYDMVFSGEEVAVRPSQAMPANASMSIEIPKRASSMRIAIQEAEASTTAGRVQLMGGTRAGRTQRGNMWIDDPVEILQKNAETIRETMKRAPTITATGTLTSERYNELRQLVKAGEDLDPALGARTESRTDVFVRKVFDTAGPIKHKLQVAGGQQVKDRFNLIKGTPSAAQERFNAFEREVYAGLDKVDEFNLDTITFARRVAEIDRYKGVGTVAHMGKTNAAETLSMLDNLKHEIGAEKFALLDARADKVFQSYQTMLDRLHQEGILTPTSYERMNGLKYQPQEVIRYIDPETKYSFHGQTVTVSDSGIRHLEHGSTGPIRTKSRLLLAEATARVEGRIKKNEANLALRDFAEAIPDNGFVRSVPVEEWAPDGTAVLKDPKPPLGYTRVYGLKEGKQHPIDIIDQYAEQWVTAGREMSADMGNFFRLASGSTIVKSLATTYNPAFPLKNIPRDMMAMWINSGEYSGTLPIAGVQLGKDMFTVLPDALARRGRYKDFISEGGGTNFMTHQGQSLLRERNPVERMTDPWRKAHNALSYVNEFSELLTRLALRERAIQNGKTGWEATAAAREYMDFSNGGSWARGVDTMIPYFNAALQAYYGAAKQIRSNPGRFAWQATQVVGIGTMVPMAAMSVNPEAWKQIPTKDKINNIIVSPKDHFILDSSIDDPNGNKRHVYYKLALDQTAVPLYALGVAMAEYSLWGKAPDDLMQKTLKNLNPAGLPPTLSAGLAYLANYNAGLDKQVWMGEKTLPEKEIIPGFMPNATPKPYVQLGAATGASPERTRAAVNQVVPSNAYLNLMGGSFQYLMSGMTDYEKARTTQLMFAQLPDASRVIGLTHPAAMEIDRIDQAVRERNAVKGPQHDAIQGFVLREIRGEGSASDAFGTWVKEQAPEDIPNLVKQFKATFATEKIFQRYKPSDGIPSKTWWRQTGMADPKVRGELFAQEWSKANSEDRQRMVGMAQAMKQFNLGYWSDDMVKAFQAERRRLGE